MSIIIKEVVSRKELKKFVRFPRILYQDSPYYAPSLETEDIQTLTSHPAKSFCEIRLWLAYKGNAIVGRVAGIINHRCNALKGERRIRFGWLDMIEDVEVAKALMTTVENWGRERELLTMSGPSRFSNMEKQGMLVEGFEEMPPVSCEYNYPYYPQLLEQLGFEKEVDYLQYKNEVKEIPEKIKHLSQSILEKYKIKIKEFKDKKELVSHAHAFFIALNNSFVDIYNFIPLTEPEIDYLIKSNFSFINKDLVCILVDENDKVIGVSLSVPSLNKAFKKARGKLFPVGWYHILKALKRKNDTVDLYLTGVLPEWVHKGIHALYHYQLHETFIEKGFQYAITNQQMEILTGSRVWEKYNGKMVFRRRCYRRDIS